MPLRSERRYIVADALRLLDTEEEYQLVADSGFKKWPPRLEGQPIFYPVTNEIYAREITEQWNIRDSGIGYVFRFLVQQPFAAKYTVEKVGGKNHTEWWIPSSTVMLFLLVLSAINATHTMQYRITNSFSSHGAVSCS